MNTKRAAIIGEDNCNLPSYNDITFLGLSVITRITIQTHRNTTVMTTAQWRLRRIRLCRASTKSNVRSTKSTARTHGDKVEFVEFDFVAPCTGHQSE